MTPNHNLQSPAIKAGLEKYKPELCKYRGCTLYFSEIHLTYTYDICLIHIDGKTGDRTFLPLWKNMMTDGDFDVWGVHCLPWLEKQHYDFSGLEMNG